MTLTIKGSNTVLKGNTTVGFSPASLFAAGEQGVWYDPSDFSTMFQDAAGTTPVTAVEQSVGLLLDKRGGLGPNLVINGDFSNGTTGWENITGTLSVSSGVGTVTTLGSFGYVRQTITTVVGRTYKINCKARVGTTNTTSLSIGAGAASFSTSSATDVLLGGFYTATATSTLIWMQNSAAGTAFFDDISVCEVSPNYATQSTAGNRPVLSARVNLFTKTQEFDNAVWQLADILAFGSGSVANATIAPDGTTTADLITEKSGTAQPLIYISGTSATNSTVSFYVKANGRNYVQIVNNSVYANFDLTNGAVGSYTGFTSPQITSAGNGWYRVSAISPSGTAVGLAMINSTTASYRQSYTGDGTSGIFIWGADLRVSNDGVGLPVYQRVNTSTDYDTTGFPFYLAFNGTTNNRSMATGSVDFTGTNKMSVFSGVRKIGAASDQILIELSSTAASNNGSFVLAAPGSATANSYAYYSRGTTLVGAIIGGYTAPITNVVSGLSDISAPQAQLRVNGAVATTNTASQGTGNFGNYPLYIGARGGSSLYFDGRIYSLIVRGAPSTSDQITATENWVNTKTRAYSV